MSIFAPKQPAQKSVKQEQYGSRERSPRTIREVRSPQVSPTNLPRLQRQCACGGGCPRCQESTLLQTKLKFSEPGDAYEQEADRIASEIMQMPEVSMQRQMAGEEEEEIVQRKAIAEAPSIVHEVLNSPGQPLDSQTRTFMESRFGQNFSHVRIHTDGRATEAAAAVNAKAYTVHNHIVFWQGQYSPETREGQRLLAHELTHVLQNSQQRVQPNLGSKPANISSTTA